MSTQHHQKPYSLLAGALLALPLLLSAPRAEAAISDVPLFLTIPVPPMAIINMSKDHQLFYKAYNDFSDLNDDGTIETTYDDALDYYGYFNNLKCYTYDSAQSRFEPSALATGVNKHYCTGAWSGNFLNWAAMSRMDVVRKILYGGKRVVDTATDTVLERAYLPTDAHSWAKYYNGADIAQLTPFTVLNTNPVPVTSDDSISFPLTTDFVCKDNDNNFNNCPEPSPTPPSGCGIGVQANYTFRVSDVSSFQPGDQVNIESIDDLNRGTMVAGVCSVDTTNSTVTFRVDPGSSLDSAFPTGGPFVKWELTNLSRTGISFCNTTYQSTGLSQDSTSAPLLRVAQGNFALWSANEVTQCEWSEEANNRQSGFAGGFRSNGNRAAFSLLNASAENASKSVHGLGDADYTVRVEVCPGTTFSEGSAEDLYGCKQYTDGNLKPIGLLQEFGDEDQIQFGLLTGSYDKNISGGVLRKAVSSFTTEVNEDTNGTFTGVSGMVSNLDAIRIYGYDYGSGNHYGSGDNCTYQLTSITEGNCRSWGNPMSEIYLESLRYLAGQAATPAFEHGTAGADAALGLTLVSPWADPLSDANYCAPLNVLNFNASVSSYDNDDLGGFSDLGATSTAAALTSNVVGADESVNGADWFVGNTGVTSNDLCSAKTVGGLGDVFGLCPEAPASEGTYLMSGMAYYAHTNQIRSDLDVPNSDTESLKVTTYGVALATNVPRIDIPVPGSPGKTVTILPAYRLDRSSTGGGPFGAGGLVDFKVVQPHTEVAGVGTGRFYVNWEDSEQGGDYDQDMWGVIAYEITATKIIVATKAVSASTANGQGFGYIISGTTQDGSHFHSGIYDFDYTDPTNITVVDGTGTPLNGTGAINASGGCTDCVISDPATIGVYDIGGTAAGVLKDPLWYTAKYGGFVDDNDNALPDQTIEWDEDGNGEPDTFFFATNPLKLETALRDAFKGVAETQSSAASVATNSTRLDTETVIYQARFDSKDWTGQLLAFDIIDTGPDAGQVGDVVWDAGAKLEAVAPAARNIFTFNPSANLGAGDGVSFAWLNLDTTQQGYLNTDPVSGTADTLGQDRLDYVRGDHSKEEQNGGAFRNRSRALGDIVNSDPFFVAQPDFRYFLLRNSDGTVATDGAAYSAFRNSAAYQARPSVVYIGGNDGMLHAFIGSDDPGTGGTELFAYVPNIVFENLNDMPNPDYSHKFFVDGSPRVGDTYFSGAWHTVLVGGLGAGGKGIYALDVTDPANFTATDVLWEFGAADDADLGFSFAQPTIVRLVDGNWYVLLANGYGSSTGTATLYLLNIADGTIFKEFTLDAGTGNGLSAPIPIDIDGDRITDQIYAGDLKGNLWRVDVDDATPSQWGSAFKQGANPAPLFIATDSGGTRQPITSRPDVGLHDEGGLIVLFGTGKYFETTDNVVGATPPVQTFYGIRDNDLEVARSELQAQTIEFEGPAFGLDIRVISATDVDYTIKKGWYLDLVSPVNGAEGERVVANPLLRAGRIIFTTLIPSPATLPCDFGGTSWLMEMDAISGKRLNESVFDLNGDGVFDASDFAALDTNNDGVIDANLPVSGQRSEIGIVKTPGIVSAGSSEYKYLSGSSGTIDVVTESGSDLTGRQSWRQLRQ